MKLTEDDLRQLYEESTAPGDPSGCLDAPVLIRAAEKRLGDAERDAVSGHIARCSECARGYRIARSMQSLGEARPRRWEALAAAAVLAIVLPAWIWLVVQRQRDRETIAELRATLAQDQRPVVIRTPDRSAELIRPQFDTPIVDLDSDVTRGDDRAASIVVPPDVDLLTTILHLDEPAAGMIGITIEGPGPWGGTWRAATPAATLPLTLHRLRFPTGTYVVRARAGGREESFHFRVEWR